MENSKKANATNENINLQADALTDLPVAEELAGETRGGAVGGHIKVFDGRGGYSSSGDEFDDIIVGARPGAGPHVK